MTMLRNALVCVVLACPLVRPVPVAAQTRAFELLWDSLAQVTSVEALRLRRARLPDGQGAATAVERGLIDLRLYQLSGEGRELDRAQETFERAADRFPDVAWAHYGLAVALLERAGQDAHQEGFLGAVAVDDVLARALGRDPRARARAALRHALDVDPLFIAAASRLAALATEAGNAEDLQIAHEALQRAREAGRQSFDLSLALADAEFALGNYEPSVAAAEAGLAAARGGRGDEALALYVHARGLLLLPGHEEEGARAYFSAADRLTAETAERVYADVLPLLSDADRGDWHAADAAGRAAWLRAFWSERARQAIVPVPERLAEHYRRLARARRDYPRNERLGAPPEGALLAIPSAERLGFDDRGIILIRHGEPDEVVRTPIRGLRPNETWVYRDGFGGRPLMFDFVALRGANDFYLVTDIIQALDLSLPLTDAEFSEAVVRLLEDRARYEQRYRLASLRFQSALRGGLTLSVGDVRLALQEIDAERRTQVLHAVGSDSYAPRFADELPFYYDFFTFRGPDERTELTAAMAIPATELEPGREGDRDVYALKLALVVYDTLTGATATIDTLLLYGSAEPLGMGDYVRTHVKLAVDPGPHARYRLTLANAQAESTGKSYTGTLAVPDYRSRSDLMISDIVLAAPDTAGVWTRGGARLALVPPRQFSGGEPFTLFYEIYNLPEGAPYRTEILIEAVEGGGVGGWLRGLLGIGRDRRVRLRFDELAHPVQPPGAVQELRRVTSNLAAGRYRIRIAVSDLATGRTATREREFIILE